MACFSAIQYNLEKINTHIKRPLMFMQMEFKKQVEQPPTLHILKIIPALTK
jgi:hypothetical protein